LLLIDIRYFWVALLRRDAAASLPHGALPAAIAISTTSYLPDAIPLSRCGHLL
jgi:hypothetical protein